ncbi:hypothetical protein LQZ19_12965 [Treponema primitia]|uniref:hypothetical protein n=1 Tax=Treponema primitia TaxID=88058 RepID=UPI0039810BDE
MEKITNNIEYQGLLRRYHGLKEEMNNLDKDRSLFEFAIILDSGTEIHPDYNNVLSNYRHEKHKTLEQLLDICAPVENPDLKNRTDIVSQTCGFSKWGFYFLCMFPGYGKLKELLMSQPIPYYENKRDYFKEPLRKELWSEKEIFFSWLKSSCESDQYQLREASFDFCFTGEKYLLE